MSDSIIKHSSQFSVKARSLKRFLKPIISYLITQADALEYSIWRTTNHQNEYPAEYWDTVEALAIERGWRVTRVHRGDKLEFILFSPAICDKLTIDKRVTTLFQPRNDTALSVDEQDRLSAALLAQGFALTEQDENTLIYAKTRQGAILIPARYSRILTDNPFPEAQTFLKSERGKSKLLKHFAGLIEDQAEEHGYVVEFFNTIGNDQLAAIESALAKAHWQVTKVMNGQNLDFVLLTPAHQLKIDIRTGGYGKLSLKEGYREQRSLNEDDQNRLIEALAQNSYQLTERDAHYLSFERTTTLTPGQRSGS